MHFIDNKFQNKFSFYIIIIIIKIYFKNNKGEFMSVLVIGADEITPIRAVLHDLGAKK